MSEKVTPRPTLHARRQRAFGFLWHGLECSQAIPRIRETRGFHFLPQILTARSLEYALKAYLLMMDRPIDKVRALNHDLLKLQNSADTFGLSKHVTLTKEARHAVCELNEWYKNKDLEYYSVRDFLLGRPEFRLDLIWRHSQAVLVIGIAGLRDIALQTTPKEDADKLSTLLDQLGHDCVGPQ